MIAEQIQPQGQEEAERADGAPNRFAQLANEIHKLPERVSQTGMDGASLAEVNDKIANPDRILEEGNRVNIRVGDEIIEGDAIARTPSGTYLVYRGEGLQKVQDPYDETVMIVPDRVKSDNIRPAA